jgi:hypothetical protein
VLLEEGADWVFAGLLGATGGATGGAGGVMVMCVGWVGGRFWFV